MLHRFVFLEKPLQLAVRITSGPDQVLFGIRQLVLFESRFGFGELDPNLQVVSFTPLGKRALRGQLLDLFLVHLDLRFNRLNSLLDGPGLLGLGVRLLVCNPQRIGERQIRFMVGHPQGLVRQSLLLLSDCEARQLLGSLERPPVNPGRPISRRRPPPSACRLRVGRTAGQNQAGNRRPNEYHESGENQLLRSFHNDFGSFHIRSRHSKRCRRTRSSKPAATRPRSAIGAAKGATHSG